MKRNRIIRILILIGATTFITPATDAQKISIGTYTFKNGDIYNGQLVGGRPNGKGKTQMANGDTYEGGYLKGKRYGQGTYTFTDGEKYVGEWLEDHQHQQ